MPLSFSRAGGVDMTGPRRFPVSLRQASDQAYASINHSEPRLTVLSMVRALLGSAKSRIPYHVHHGTAVRSIDRHGVFGGPEDTVRSTPPPDSS
jgi:hypothetical protein